MFQSPNTINAARKYSYIAIIFFLLIILALKLYDLQIRQFDRFSGIADANRIRVVQLETPRGIIYDRNGVIIADNKSQYNVNVIPFDVPEDRETYVLLAKYLEIPEETIQKRVKKNWRGNFHPARIAEDIEFKTLTKIEEHILELPGVMHSIEPLRSFPMDVNLSHVIGYLREISPGELKKYKEFDYQQGDLIGWKGIEREYESILRGKRGFRYQQVDALGREVGSLADKKGGKATPGNDLYLTINIELQKFAESIMDTNKGVIIMMDAENGEILACTSKPDYSPNLFSGIVNPEDWNNLRNNPDQPLYNRLIAGTYPPGSTFKIIAAITALENDYADSSTTFICNRTYQLGRRSFKCLGAHGPENMHDAIVHSCNIYFYNLIRHMDFDTWAKTARMFGFDRATGVDIPGENRGVIPDTEFMNAKYGKGKWTEGNLLNMVIGQGDVLTTPMQLARFAAALATKGKMVTPHLGFKYYDKAASQFVNFTATADSIDSMKKSTWRFIMHAMSDAVYDKKGTARHAAVKGMKVYGKTGSAQNPHGEAHAWYLGFGKINDRKIAQIVLVEHGRSGGGTASPIAGKMYQKYLEIFVNNKLAQSDEQ